jgi:hypothetical protein
MSSNLRQRNQQRMMSEIAEQDRKERRQVASMQKHSSSVLDHLFYVYSRLLLGLVFVAILAGAYFYPEIKKRFFKSKPKLPPVPRRQLVTRIPYALREALPPFLGRYAIATPQNEASRLLLQQLYHNQKYILEKNHIQWQYVDAALQLSSYCGEEWANNDDYDDLLAHWCLMLQPKSAGSPAHGYVDRRVKLFNDIPRQKGVVGVLQVQQRIHPGLFILPARNRTTEWPDKVQDLVLREPETLSEYLYEYVQSEREEWDLWTVACNQTLGEGHLMASFCDPECCYFYE